VLLEIYCSKSARFDGHELRQSTQLRARIMIATNALREEAAIGRTVVSVDIAQAARSLIAYRRAN